MFPQFVLLCLFFYEKCTYSFMANTKNKKSMASKYSQVNGHWQVWQYVSFRPWAQRYELISLSWKGRGSRFRMSTDHRSMNHYRVSPKSWYVTFPRLQPLLHGAEIIMWKNHGWLAFSPLSFDLFLSPAKSSFQNITKAFIIAWFARKHAIICLHCHSAWYIMDAFVSCSLQS